MVPLPLPELSEITWVLEELFGKDIRASACDALPINSETGAIVTLIDSSRRVRAVWMFDVALANIVGTALALGHPDKAARATADNVIMADTRENIIEVVNVGASAINGEGRIPVRLGPAAFIDDGSFGHDLWRTLAKQALDCPGFEHSCRLRVSGYGSGCMTVQSFGFSEEPGSSEGVTL